MVSLVNTGGQIARLRWALVRSGGARQYGSNGIGWQRFGVPDVERQRELSRIGALYRRQSGEVKQASACHAGLADPSVEGKATLDQRLLGFIEALARGQVLLEAMAGDGLPNRLVCHDGGFREALE